LRPVSAIDRAVVNGTTLLRAGGAKVGLLASPSRRIEALAWCDNLECYSDYASRLPRGRSYVRNGSVVDLRIERGQLHALVSGSAVYTVKIDIAVAKPSRWRAICGDCAGSVGSLVELLQGKLSKNVMERVCRAGDGLFPAPGEIKMSCSCPDWADMCKHVAATLYGAGARLDAAPDHKNFAPTARPSSSKSRRVPKKRNSLTCGVGKMSSARS
jgi:SWIM zinc finger